MDASSLNRAALQILSLQLAIGAVALGGLAFVPGTGPLWVPTGIAAVVSGAWGWAIFIGARANLLDRLAVRGLAARVGGGFGISGAVTYLIFAPGRVPYPILGVAGVAAALGIGGGLGATGLTLCGLDLGRSAPPRDRRDSGDRRSRSTDPGRDGPPR